MKLQLNKELLKMQKLAGLITEGEYKGRLNENQSSEVEAFLKSKGYRIEKVDGSTEAEEREGEFAATMEKDPNIVKQKNSKAFITSDDLIHDGVKSFMVFIPSLSPESKDNASLKNEIIKKFGADDPQTGAFFTSLKIPAENKNTVNEQEYKFSDTHDQRVKLLRPLLKPVAQQAANAIYKMGESGKFKEINDQEGGIGNNDLSLALGVEVLAALQGKIQRSPQIKNNG